MPHLAEDLTWIKGDHQILFDGGIYQQRLNYSPAPTPTVTPHSPDRAPD
jgi:hypothetical protein